MPLECWDAREIRVLETLCVVAGYAPSAYLLQYVHATISWHGRIDLLAWVAMKAIIFCVGSYHLVCTDTANIGNSSLSRTTGRCTQLQHSYYHIRYFPITYLI